MAWSKGGTTTLGVAAGTIDVSLTTAKKFMVILESRLDQSTLNNDYIRVGNSTIDTGSNYAYRYATNGGADGTGVSNSIMVHGFFATNSPKFMVNYMVNIGTEEKLLISFAIDQSSSGSGSAPLRNKSVGKWSNTSNQIDIWQSRSDNGIKTYAADSNTTIIGSD